MGTEAEVNVTVRMSVQDRDRLRALAAKRILAGKYICVAGLIREAVANYFAKEKAELPDLDAVDLAQLLGPEDEKQFKKTK